MKIACCKGHKEVAMTVFARSMYGRGTAGAAHLPRLAAVFVRRPQQRQNQSTNCRLPIALPYSASTQLIVWAGLARDHSTKSDRHTTGARAVKRYPTH